jgi:hypothetical protein
METSALRSVLGVVLVMLAACHPAAPTSRAVEADASASALPLIAPAPASVPRERAAVSPRPADAGSPEIAPECSQDVDCAITHRLPNCCTGCAPRALPVTARDSFEARCEGQEGACIQPLCRAPPAPPAAACVFGRCEVRPSQIDRR